MNERTNEEKFFSSYVRSENLSERESIVWNLNVNSRSIPMVFGFIVLFGSVVRDALYFPDEMQIFLQASENVLAEGAGVSTWKREREEHYLCQLLTLEDLVFSQNVNLTDYVYNSNTEHSFINNFPHFRESFCEVSASLPLDFIACLLKEIDLT